MNLIRLNIQRFAAEASVSESIISQDVSSNTSVVRLTYKVKRTSGTTYWSDAKTITFTCDGQTASKTLKFPSGAVGATASVSADFTISHNSDGTKTISYSVKNSVGSSVNLSPNPVDGNYTLTTIPRKSDIDSVGNITLGNACNVKWTPKATSFQYKITFSIGKWSYTTGYIKPNTTSQYTYTGYTIPLDVANQITTSSSGTITTTLTSYNGSNEIGTSTKSFTASVPNNSSTKPTISGISYSEANQDVINTNWGVFLKNKSQLNVSYSTSGKYGASVKTTTITIGGNAYTNKATLTNSGSLVVSANDSRGFNNSATGGTITLVDYEKPKITTALCNRCLEDGTNDDNGEYLKYTFVGSVSSVNNKNIAIFKIRYKESTQSTYTDVDLNATNYTLNENEQILKDGDGTKIQFSSDISFDIQFVANDTLGTETTQNAQLETGADLINFNASGKSIAFGKVSEASENERLFEIDDDMIFKLGNYNASQFIKNGITNPEFVPSGDMLSGAYWRAIPGGVYYFNKNRVSCTNYPSSYGVIHKIGGDGDFSVLFHQQAYGSFWRTSGNSNSTTLTWNKISYQQEVILYDGSSVHGNITLSDSASNYDYLVVFYGLVSWGGYQMTMRVGVSGTYFLNLMYTWSTAQIAVSTTAISVNGNTISFADNRTTAWFLRGTPAETNYPIGICKVVGIKNSM